MLKCSFKPGSIAACRNEGGFCPSSFPAFPEKVKCLLHNKHTKQETASHIQLFMNTFAVGLPKLIGMAAFGRFVFNNYNLL